MYEGESSKLAYTCAYSGYKWAWSSIIYESIVIHYLYMYTYKFDTFYN